MSPARPALTPRRITVFEGDGVGPEICRAALTVLDAATRRFDLPLHVEAHPVGLEALQACGSTLPQASLEAATRSDGVILGPLSTYDYPAADQGGVNASAELRATLGLFANIRPSRYRPGIDAHGAGMDLVLVRENTEGMYAVRSMYAGAGEFMPSPDIALAVRKISRSASQAIARTAYELARRRRRHVTVVHKANVLRLTDGLFLEAVREVAQDFPDVATTELLVDAAAAMLVRAPASFDVLVTTNLFGDILSNEAAELSGSLGLGGSLNVGDHHCLAQAAHGSAPTLAGQNVANPIGIISSMAMLLQHLGNTHADARFLSAHDAIDRGVDDLLLDPATRTQDLGGDCSTDAFAAHLGERLFRDPPRQVAYGR